MTTAVVILSVVAALASVTNATSDGRISLVTFDGKPGTTFNFTKQDKVGEDGQPAKMKSSGTWDVAGGYGALDADVVTEWNDAVGGWGWPGLMRATAEGDFADASSTLGGSLILQVRSTTPGYAGFKISLATPEKWPKDQDYGCDGSEGPFANRGCYKASFTVPPSADFVSVQIPLTNFGGAWLYGSGNTSPGMNCTESKIPGRIWPHKLPANECLTAKSLADIKQISIWAEGVAGTVNLQVRSISAIPAVKTDEKLVSPLTNVGGCNTPCYSNADCPSGPLSPCGTCFTNPSNFSMRYCTNNRL